MADTKWIPFGGTSSGNWSDANHWDAGVPDSSTNAIFDVNSIDAGSRTITMDSIDNCLDMDWTDVTNSPTFDLADSIRVYGSLTFVAGMVFSGTGGLQVYLYGAGSHTLTFAGNSLSDKHLTFAGAGTYTLQDAFTNTGNLNHSNGTFDTNGQTVTTGRFQSTGASTRVTTLGSSTVNTSLEWEQSGSNNTLNANTSTIKLTGTCAFIGGDQTYNKVELNGTAHTISGDNTFSKLSAKPAAAQALTFTDTSTQTVDEMERTGTGLITITGTGAAGYALVKSTAGSVSLENTSISYLTATPPNVWFFPPPVTVGAGNNNLRYCEPYAGSGWFAMGRF